MILAYHPLKNYNMPKIPECENFRNMPEMVEDDINNENPDIRKMKMEMEKVLYKLIGWNSSSSKRSTRPSL